MGYPQVIGYSYHETTLLTDLPPSLIADSAPHPISRSDQPSVPFDRLDDRVHAAR